MLIHRLCRLGLGLALVFPQLIGFPSGRSAQHPNIQPLPLATHGADRGVRGNTFTFQGIVLEPDGNFAEGAVVVSSVGGQAITNALGAFELEIQVPAGAERLQITSVGGKAGRASASQEVILSALPGWNQLAPQQLLEGNGCQARWLPTFGVQPGADGDILAMAVFDDGTGSALYVGGTFTSIGSIAAGRVARWDGTNWTPLGQGIMGSRSRIESVTSLCVFDDGTGEALFVGGDFAFAANSLASNIAKWDGHNWSTLGNGIRAFSSSRTPVNAMSVFDDGTGAQLYVGGRFIGAGNSVANNLAMWNGTNWTALPEEVNSTVHALTVFDAGNGAELYAGGEFLTAGGLQANHIASWNGARWAALGSGMNNSVRAFTSFDDGGGSQLYAAGNFRTAGGSPANRVASWDGSRWTALGSGFGGATSPAPIAHSLMVFDDGNGTALFAGGSFLMADGAPANRIAKWDGSRWTSLDSGANDIVFAMAVFDDGGGETLFAGGQFTDAGGLAASRIANWNGSSWSVQGDGLNGSVLALTSFDDGEGPALFAGGEFTRASGLRVNHIAKWDGATWLALDTGLGQGLGTTSVNALAVYDDGGGEKLYVGGNFRTAGPLSATNLAMWDGLRWEALSQTVNGAVETLAVFDPGGGAELYVGGSFPNAGGMRVNHIASWNGSSWKELDQGVSGTGVFSLLAFDDGDGAALYVGGNYTAAGGTSANRIAKWDGFTWTALRNGLGGGSVDTVRALAVYDEGQGPRLFAGGDFRTRAAGHIVNHVARWDGSRWHALSIGLNDDVCSLAVIASAGQRVLVAGGSFTRAGGALANHLAVWNGTHWAPLDGGTNASVRALVPIDEGGQEVLFAGGEFAAALDSGDSYLAKRACAPDINAPRLACPQLLSIRDRHQNGPGETVSFSVTATDEHDPAPIIVCTPASGSFFPNGETLVSCTATDASGNASSCSFLVHVGMERRD